MPRNLGRLAIFALPLGVAALLIAPFNDAFDWQKQIKAIYAKSSSAHALPQRYSTNTASRGDIRKEVTGTGVVRPVVSVLVGSQLSGQIAELKVSYNAMVNAGEVLAILDDKMFVSKVKQAEAELITAKSGLLNQVAALEKAEALRQQAELGHERQQALAKSNTTTRAQLENATRDLLVARAEISVANALIASARATINHREALLEQAKIDLDRTRIKSPISGVVLSRMVEVGQTVAASLQSPELFRIAKDLKDIQVEAQIAEADIGSVQAGNAVVLTVDAFPDKEFSGRVGEVRLAATVEQNIVTYTVVIDVDNAELRLFPGMTANVRIETARRENVVRISAEALRFKPRDPKLTPLARDAADPRQRDIWVLAADGRVERRTVRVGVNDGTNVEVADGDLAQGTQVIVRGLATSRE